MKTIKITTENSYLKGYDENGKLYCHLPLNNSPILEGVPLLPPLEDDDYVYKLQHTSLCEIDRQFGEDVMYNLDVFIKGYNKAKEKYKGEIQMYKNMCYELLKILEK